MYQVSFNLESFYREALGFEYPEVDLDLTSVARTADADGITAIVQLLVGAAVSCEGKSDYIQAIMQARRRNLQRGRGGHFYLAAFGLRHQGAGGMRHVP